MNEHQVPTIERRCDVAVIGGSAAGLAAALQLGRQRRSVIMVDSGEPRNGPAAQMHSHLGHEGRSPAEFATIAREEVRNYGVEILSGRALDVTRRGDGLFCVDLAGGHSIVARRIVAATGLIDVLPDIAGLAEHWGRNVIHCPFCHGYEVRDRQIAQIVTHPTGFHSAGLFRQLTDRLTLILHDGVDADDDVVDTLRASGVVAIGGRAQRIVDDGAGHLTGVELEDGTFIEADAVAIGTRFEVRVDPFASLGIGLVAHPSGLGDVVDIDASGETSVRGVYAVGNVTDPVLQVLPAAAHASTVAGLVCVDLAREDIASADRPSANRAEWEHRYRGEQVWSGNPNGTLVREAGSLAPRRALDVGAGEGGDAVWLAEHGWTVTATDIAEAATVGIAAVASERDLPIDTVRADVNADRPFDTEAFDLVTAHYASIPRTPDRRGVTNVIDAVAPGGTLLVVGHAPEPIRAPIDTKHHTRPFDPDAYVRVDDFLDAVRDDPCWHVVSHDTRRRPPGSATGAHHVDDVVLRLYRRAR